MKGVILHGGHGTRLRPLTHTGPKQLIKIAGKPISQWGIESLRDNGVTEIAVILGDHNPMSVVDYYGDGRNFGVKITYIYQGKAKGIAHAVNLCRDFVGDDNFVVYLGDNVLLDGLEKLVRFDGDATILLAKVPDPNRFGVAIIQDGKVIRLVEKPKDFISDLALVGVYAFTPAIFDAIDRLVPSGRGELEITEGLQLLIDDGRTVNYAQIEGWWKDTGIPGDLLDANIRLLDKFCPESDKINSEGSKIEGRVQVGEDSKIKNSVIIGPVSIGAGTTVSDSFIGPFTSIGDKCTLERAEINNSIIFDYARILDVKIGNSIIGRSASVSKSKEKPVVSKLIVGEGGSVLI